MICLFHPNLLCSILKEKSRSLSVKKVDELKKRKQWTMSLGILAITMDLLETGSYVDFASKNIEAMEYYYSNVMGLTLVEKDADGIRYLSTGLDHHHIALTPSNQSDLQCIGFQLGKQYELKDVEKQLKQQGISAKLKSDARPGLPKLIELTDPDDFIVHLFINMEISYTHLYEDSNLSN